MTRPTLLTAQKASPKLAGAHAVAGYRSAILYLAPSDHAGFNVCSHASEECVAGCLYEVGRAESPGRVRDTIHAARIARVRWLVADPVAFMAALVREIESHVRCAERDGLTPTLRLNGTSDIPWHRLPCMRNGIAFASIYHAFPEVRFYEYTKVPTFAASIAAAGLADRVRVTFSLSENNDRHALDVLASGGNVAAVIHGGYATLPTLPRYAIYGSYDDHATNARHARQDGGEKVWSGYPAIDGDAHDLRFLDPVGPCIVALKVKGRANQRSASPFFRESLDSLDPSRVPLAARGRASARPLLAAAATLRAAYGMGAAAPLPLPLDPAPLAAD